MSELEPISNIEETRHLKKLVISFLIIVVIVIIIIVSVGSKSKFDSLKIGYALDADGNKLDIDFGGYNHGVYTYTFVKDGHPVRSGYRLGGALRTKDKVYIPIGDTISIYTVYMKRD